MRVGVFNTYWSLRLSSLFPPVSFFFFFLFGFVSYMDYFCLLETPRKFLLIKNILQGNTEFIWINPLQKSGMRLWANVILDIFTEKYGIRGKFKSWHSSKFGPKCNTIYYFLQREIYEKNADDIFNIKRFEKHHPYSEKSGYLY